MMFESQLNDWVSWGGASLPPKVDGEIEVLFRSGEKDEGFVHEFVWTVDDVEADIVAWRRLKPELELNKLFPWNKLDQPSPLETQIGGAHYKNFEIQPVEFIDRNKIPFLEGCVIKRMCRHMDKNGVEDLIKAKHEIDLIIELRYGE